jgi:DNA polymerase I-like protein with 3'-5' exonuclease and polymerase domains
MTKEEKVARVAAATIHQVCDFSFLRVFFRDAPDGFGLTWVGPTYSGIDIETEGVLSPHDGEVATVQIELNGECWVVHWDINKTLATVPDNEYLRFYLECKNVVKIIHNAKFEMSWFLHTFGYGLRAEPLHDTMIGEYILAEGAGEDTDNFFAKPKLDLGSVVQKRYGVEMDKDTVLRMGFRRKGHVLVTPAKIATGYPMCACGMPADLFVGARSGVPACTSCEAVPGAFTKRLKRVPIDGADYVSTSVTHEELDARQLAYAAFDALWAAQIARDQITEMIELEVTHGENYLSLLDLDSRTAEVIARMELHGVPLNREKLECLDAEWQYEEQRLREDIEEALCFDTLLPQLQATEPDITLDVMPVRLGYWVKPNKAKIKKFKDAGLPKPEPEFKEGRDFPKISSNDEMTARLQAAGYAVPSYESHELKHFKGDALIDNILRWKMISKLQSTYSDGFLRRTNQRTMRLHGSFSQTTTSTGRLAATDPNMQNLPSKSKEGLMIRDCVDAAFYRIEHNGEEWVLVVADYSQIELRLIAEMYGDEAMRQAFRDGRDLHSLFASKMLGISYEEMEAGKDGVYKVHRSQAKPANFGLGYGAGVDQFMFIAWSQYGIILSREEATKIRSMWLETWQGVGAYHNRTKQMIKNGTGLVRVRTQDGRTRRMQREWINSDGERKTAYAATLNHPIQGTGADGVKKAMISIAWAPELPPDARVVLQVHDELVVLCRKADAEHVKECMERRMIAAMQPYLPTIPCLVDAKISPRWSK